MAKDGSSRRVKWLVILIVLAVLIGGGIWDFAGVTSEPPQYQPTAVPRGDLTQTVTANGTLNPVVNIQVGSQISGNIQKLFADFNSKVKAGDIVAQIDPLLFQAAVP